jgi:hypothetical protein
VEAANAISGLTAWLTEMESAQHASEALRSESNRPPPLGIEDA